MTTELRPLSLIISEYNSKMTMTKTILLCMFECRNVTLSFSNRKLTDRKIIWKSYKKANKGVGGMTQYSLHNSGVTA